MFLVQVIGQRDICYQSTIHDVKILISKFAQEKSFSVESGGGGPQSNLHLLPYLSHMALYVINTTRAGIEIILLEKIELSNDNINVLLGPRELSNIESWLSNTPAQWVEQATAAEGPLYYTAMCMLLMSPEKWTEKRHLILQRLLLTVHVRAGSPVNKTQLFEYSKYRYKSALKKLYIIIIRDHGNLISENI